LQNKIYGYILSNHPPFYDALAVSSSCRKARAEFLPLYFQRATVLTLEFYLVQRSLSTFFPRNNIEILEEDVCAIRVKITGEQRNANPVIDMKWFLGFVLDHPGFKVEFDGCTSFAWEASDLVKLVDVVKSNAFWRTRLASFESIKLRTYTCWRPGRTKESGRYARRPVWILQIVLEPGDVQDRVNSEECRAYTKGWLVDMGLRTIDEAEREHSTFRGLKIQAFKNDRSSALDSGEHYW
jgi:hypothetical protein